MDTSPKIKEIDEIRKNTKILYKKICDKYYFVPLGEKQAFKELQKAMDGFIEIQHVSILKERINQVRNILMKMESKVVGKGIIGFKEVEFKKYEINSTQHKFFISTLNILDKELSRHSDYLFEIKRKFDSFNAMKHEKSYEAGREKIFLGENK